MERYFLGIDLGGSNITAAVVTAGGRIICSKKTTTAADQGHQAVIRRMLEIGRAAASGCQGGWQSLQALGVGAPGIIDIEKGMVLSSPNLPDWKKIPLRRLLQAASRKNVILDNDANVAAYGEKWLGAGCGRANVVVYTLGTGVGGGIISDGEIFHGQCNAAGEVGHMTILPEGPLCNCGNRGCLEALVSGTAIARMGREALDQGRGPVMRELCAGDRARLTAKMVFQAARSSDADAIGIVAAAGRYLGIAVANMVNLLNPELVIIGGGVSLAGHMLLQPVRAEAKRRALAESMKCAKIVLAKLGDQAGVIGAAGLAVHWDDNIKKRGRRRSL